MIDAMMSIMTGARDDERGADSEIIHCHLSYCFPARKRKWSRCAVYS